MEQKILLKIATLNTRGIKSNIQESFHLSYDEITKVIAVPGKKIYHKLATKQSKKGRPSGGLIYVVDEKLVAADNFPSKRIGVLTINNLALVQVYLPFYNPNDESLLEFQTESTILNNTIKQLQEDKYEVT